MTHREPTFNMVRSVLDCFTGALADETFRDKTANAIAVIRDWWKGL